MIYGAVYAALLSAGGAASIWRPHRNCLYYLALCFLFIFVAYRYEVGCDWTGYLNYYKHALGMDLRSVLELREPLFWATNVIIHQWRLQYEYVNVAAAAVYFGGFHAIARRQPNRLGFLILSFPILILHLPMSGIRQAMALGVLCLAFVAFIDRRPFRYVLYVVIASGFHTSALIFLAMTLFMFGELSWRKAAVSAVVALPMLFLIADSADFQMYAARYVSTGVEAAGAPFRTGALALVGIVFLLLLKERWRRQSPSDYNLMLIGAFLLTVVFPLTLISSVVGDRIGYYLSVFQMVILARIPYMSANTVFHPAPYMAAGALLLGWIYLSPFHFSQCYMPYANVLLL